MRNEQAPEVPVRFYRSATGREPVLEWLRGLDREDRRAIGLDLMRVQFGWRHAACAEPERRALGGAFLSARPEDSSFATVLSPEDVDRAARLHQEGAEDTAKELELAKRRLKEVTQ